MKNREKFTKEILDIACNGRSIAVTKDNKVVYCDDIDCESCMFDSCDKHIGRPQAQVCLDRLREWSESEYIEKPTITSKEKTFLDLIVAKWKYLVRDEDKNLYVFDSLPIKDWDGWCVKNMSMHSYCYISKKLFGDMFDFIKWEDEKPWLIEDLKKLEVKEDIND